MKPFERSNNKRRSESIIKVRKFKVKRGRRATKNSMSIALDPTCLIHGLKMSKHQCLFCCLCFKTLTVDECHVLPDGTKEDVCNDCAQAEESHGKT